MDATDRQRVLEDLGRRVRELRRARDWTQAEAAERVGIDLRDLQRIEAGQVNMTVVSLARLASGLDTTVRELFAPPTNRTPRRPGRPRST